MSKYRDRKHKIEQQQSKSLDQLCHNPDGNNLQPATSLWDDIHQQKKRGGYPWTHLTHNPEAEVWIDPAALPRDISTATIRRKDQSIPREWFHLPKGAPVPTVDQLLREDSPENQLGVARAISPPICGRARSKSRDPPKKKVHMDDGGYEPVGAMRAVNGSTSKSNYSKKELPPRKPWGPATPPSIDRSTKPSSPTKGLEVEGYEPVGQPHKVYEDIDHLYAKVDKTKEVQSEDEADFWQGQDHLQDEESMRQEIRMAMTMSSEEDEDMALGSTQQPPLSKKDKKKMEKALKEQRKQEEKDKKKAEKERKKLEEKEKKKAEKEMKKQEEKEKKEEAKRAKEEAKLAAKRKKEEEQKAKTPSSPKMSKKEARAPSPTLPVAPVHIDLPVVNVQADPVAVNIQADPPVVNGSRDNEFRSSSPEQKEAAADLPPSPTSEEDIEGYNVEEYSSSPGDLNNGFDHFWSQPQSNFDEHPALVQPFEVSSEAPVLIQPDKQKQGKDKAWPNWPAFSDHSEKKEKANKSETKKVKGSDFQWPKWTGFDTKDKAKPKKRTQSLSELPKAEQQRPSRPKAREFHWPKAQMPKVTLPSSQDVKESISKSVGQQLAVRVRVEDQELQRQRQQLTKNKTVAQLSQMHHPFDIPMPKMRINFPSLENKVKRTQSETALPKNANGKKMLLVTNVKVADDELSKQRRDLAASKSPSQLAQIHSLGDLPVPSTLQRLVKAKPKRSDETEEEKKWMHSSWADMSSVSGALQKLVQGGKENDAKLLVRSRYEDPEVQALRASTVKQKTVAELSQIKGLSELPVPSPVQHLWEEASKTLQRQPTKKARPETASVDAGLDRKVGQKENLENYLSLPRQQLKVRSRLEEPEIQEMRAQAVKAKSVHELSQIKSLDDFPLPTTLEAWVGRKGSRPVERRKRFREKQRSMSTKSLQDKFDAINAQKLLVTSKFQDPEVLSERRALVASRSVSELSQISALSDLPMPRPIEKLLEKSKQAPSSHKQQASSSRSRSPKDYSHLSPMSLHENIYSTLPRSMKSELLVTSKRQQNSQITVERRKLVQSKSVGELSQVKSLADLPIPTPIMTLWRQGNRRMRHLEEDGASHDGGSTILSHYTDFYSTLPAAMRKEVLVRTKCDGDYDTLVKRKALVQCKSPAELSQISAFSDFPVPRKIEDWLANAGNRPRSEALIIRPKSVIPDSLNKQCVVRTRREDPATLQSRQHLISTCTPHELSKIRNLSDMPLPVKGWQLPDIPMPTAKYMFKHRKRTIDEACQTIESSFEGFTPVSTPRLIDATFSEDHEALRFEMSSPESAILLPRDTDFGYEVIPSESKEDTSSASVADHYKGTPPPKAKKKRASHSSRQQQQSKEIDPEENFSEDDLLPPPLPPKKGHGQRESSVETTSFKSLVTSVEDDRIQSRPLPTPPTPRASRALDLAEDASETFHSLHSLTKQTSKTLVDSRHDMTQDETLAESIVDSMHTCLDTMGHDQEDNTLNEQSDEDGEELMAEMLPYDVQQQTSIE